MKVCRPVAVGLAALLACGPKNTGPARTQSTLREKAATAFTAFEPGASFVLPSIVLQHDPVAKTGVDWAAVNHPAWHQTTPPMNVGRAALYLREALRRMTGREFPVESKADLARGIVLTLAADAPPEIRGDEEVKKALATDPKDPFAANEAFYVRSEPGRVLVVANTADGLLDGVVELLESVGYEVLGMGPGWIHEPDYRSRRLGFAIERAGRPSFYLRMLAAMSGQNYGIGTIASGLSDPADEPVTQSYDRWLVGTRMAGKSMPIFPGHALQAYHRDVLAHIRETKTTEGLLTPKTLVGRDADRPAAAAETKDWCWVNADREGPGANRVFVSDGQAWKTMPPNSAGAGLDVSVPFVRETLLAAMIKQATLSFEQAPDARVLFGIDPEDGTGQAAIATQTRYRSWYPDYLSKENAPFGQPYRLHGFAGLVQPNEIWDPSSASDAIFGLANWLLREFDKWVDSLPAEQRTTRTGKSKKDLIRCSFLSYNFHDVPPSFNPDRRTAIMIAGYPKNRGRGKWEKLVTHDDMARAFAVLLPGEPPADYRILSVAQFQDAGTLGVDATWNTSAKALSEDFRKTHDVGFRAVVAETDFNFGKYGLGYYLASKVLWNARLGQAELESVRERWFRRAFGSGWKSMKAYYDYMLPGHHPFNGPMTWATAIRLIDDADHRVDGIKEPQAQRRIDDLKQFWYAHYLLNSGEYAASAPELKEFVWKGQMSYMVAMHGVLRRSFATGQVHEAAGIEVRGGRAHYTRAEVEQWWPKVLERWPLATATMFADTTLANGAPARSVDLDDLVRVVEFQGRDRETPFVYPAGRATAAPFIVVARRAGETIGFKVMSAVKPNAVEAGADKLAYGVDTWTSGRGWEPWLDPTMTAAIPIAAIDSQGKAIRTFDVALAAPRPGAYRFAPEIAGGSAQLASRGYDPTTGAYSAMVGFTFVGPAEGGAGQGPAYFYIPKKTRSVDLDAADARVRWLQLFKGASATARAPSRKIDIGKSGTHRIALEPGEDGTVAEISGTTLSVPYLYSVPQLWSKAPSALMVPRAIVKADGLTIAP